MPKRNLLDTTAVFSPPDMASGVRGPPVLRAGAFSVAKFCEAYDVSVPLLYKLWAKGEGPVFFKAGKRTLISVEAAAKWVRARERASKQFKQTGS
jgi:hypothetical protein